MDSGDTVERSGFVAGVIFFAILVALSFVAAGVAGIYGHALWLVARYGWGVL